MTGGIGTILDNISRENSNRSSRRRNRDLQERIKEAYAAKGHHQSTPPEEDTPEYRQAREETMVRIRLEAKKERARSRTLLFVFLVLAIVAIIAGFIYIL